MKRAIYIFSALALLALPSCKKFLDRTPYENLSTEGFYKTAKDIELALNGAYASLRDIKNSVEVIFNENRSDNATYQYRIYNDAWTYSALMDVDPGNSYVDQYWKYSYVLISRVNHILKHIDVVKDETVRDNYAGQAKFLRAWAYFNLVRYFGAVPLVTEPFSNGDMTRTKDRDPVDLVYDFIVSELNESKTLMTAEFNSSTDYGRANKWAATALLGKVLLTRGEKAAALPLLRDVYENSGYELIPDYGALFSESEELTVAPREVLFSVRFTPGGLSTGSIVPTFAAKDVYHGYGRNVTLYSDNLLKAFTNTTDTLVDERFHVTCSNVPGYFEGPMDLGVLSRYPAKLVGLEKGSDNAYHSVLLPTDNDAGLDYPEIRFADVVLMLAECEGNTEEGIRLLNEVRARASAPLYDETAINTLFGGDFEEAVLNERRLELAFEGDRLFDLERMGNDYMEAKLLEFYNNEKVYTDEAHFFAIVQIVKQVTNNGASIDNWRFLLPIPRNQLVRSEVMQQNPGYPN